MGGARCVFRNCKVTAKLYPKMHFFRFPVADKNRFPKWIEMSGANYMLDLPEDQQKSRVICGRHFRDEYFMNYMKDRIVRGKALPTITKISPSKAFDYEQLDEDGNPKLITLSPPTMKHLIPPPDFECPLGFVDGDEYIEESPTCQDILDILREPSPTFSQDIEAEAENETTDETELFEDFYCSEETDPVGEETFEIIFEKADQKKQKTFKRINRTTEEVSSKRSKIEESTVSETLNENLIEEDSPRENLTSQIMSTSANTFQYEDEDGEIGDVVSKDVYDDMIKHFEEQMEVERVASVAQIKKLKEENTKLSKELLKSRLSVGKLTEQYSQATNNIKTLKAENETLKNNMQTLESGAMQELKNKNILLEKNVEGLTREVNKLYKMHCEYQAFKKKYEMLLIDFNDIQDKYKKLQTSTQQSNLVSTSNAKDKTKTVQASPASGPLNKVNLFNGIKKYLNSSMIALLRMQMFGNSDREWKPDERQVSIDLLNLGENVYRNFADEWRFHLPSLGSVQQWSTESICLEEDL